MLVALSDLGDGHERHPRARHTLHDVTGRAGRELGPVGRQKLDVLARCRVLDLDLERLVAEVALRLRHVDGDEGQVGLWLEPSDEGDLFRREGRR